MFSILRTRVNKALLISIVLFFSCIKAEPQSEIGNWEWFKIIGTSASTTIQSKYVDKLNNIYLIINFSGDNTELGKRKFNVDGTSNFIITKLSSEGEVLWAEKFGESGFVNGLDMASNGDYLFIVGEMSRDRVSNEPALISKNEQALITDVRIPFILKIDVNGNLDWIRTIPEVTEYSFNSISITDSNRIFISKDYSGEDNFPILLLRGESSKTVESTNSGFIEIDKNGKLVNELEFEGNYLGYNSNIISKGDSVLFVSHGLTCFNQLASQNGIDECTIKYDIENQQKIFRKFNTPLFTIREITLFKGEKKYENGFVRIEEGTTINDISLDYDSGILFSGSIKNEEKGAEVVFSKIDNSGNLIWKSNSRNSHTGNNYSSSIVRFNNQIISTGSFIPPINFDGFEFKRINPENQFQPRSYFLAIMDSTGAIKNVIRNYPNFSSSGTSIGIMEDAILVLGEISGRTRFENFQTDEIKGRNSFIGKYKIRN